MGRRFFEPGGGQGETAGTGRDFPWRLQHFRSLDGRAAFLSRPFLTQSEAVRSVLYRKHVSTCRGFAGRLAQWMKIAHITKRSWPNTALSFAESSKVRVNRWSYLPIPS